jgi:hypothetical protein
MLIVDMHKENPNLDQISEGLNPHFPDELPDFGMQFAPTL